MTAARTAAITLIIIRRRRVRKEVERDQRKRKFGEGM
jgi:hypothetical protein